MDRPRPSNFFIILMLGALATISPLAIDLYLPSFNQISEALNTTPPKIALSLSSYFVGVASGQLFCGPLLDRYGRKVPLYIGLGLFVVASYLCLSAQSVEELISYRFLQGLAGCVAQVASVAMVRDFFPAKEGAKVFSLLMLVLSVSPLLAPTIGSIITTTLGWQWVFIVLGLIALFLMFMVYYWLPAPHEPDPTISLKVKPILKTFATIFKQPQFYTYAVSGATAFSGLFAYVAASPIIFMDIFKLSARQYGLVFAGLSIGLIAATQINILLTRKFTSGQIIAVSMAAQTTLGLCLLLGTIYGIIGLTGNLILLSLFLCSVGFTFPNAAALALAPFSKNAGSASALLGFLQIGAGALASSFLGFFDSASLIPIMGILSGTAVIGFLTLLIGRKNIEHLVDGDPEVVVH